MVSTGSPYLKYGRPYACGDLRICLSHLKTVLEYLVPCPSILETTLRDPFVILQLATQLDDSHNHTRAAVENCQISDLATVLFEPQQ